ncbi:hypothetical protein FB451DRAFT_1188426 [Mycena latifolia]|nr:hypothetical protein FB451DRAFT_1188426 [Mycena latifolia]
MSSGRKHEKYAAHAWGRIRGMWPIGRTVFDPHCHDFELHLNNYCRGFHPAPRGATEGRRRVARIPVESGFKALGDRLGLLQNEIQVLTLQLTEAKAICRADASLMLSFCLQNRTTLIFGSGSLAASRAFAALGRLPLSRKKGWKPPVMSCGGARSTARHRRLGCAATIEQRDEEAGRDSFLAAAKDLSFICVTDTVLGDPQRRSRASAERIYRACRARGVSVNTTDCDFSFTATHWFDSALRTMRTTFVGSFQGVSSPTDEDTPVFLEAFSPKVLKVWLDQDQPLLPDEPLLISAHESTNSTKYRRCCPALCLASHAHGPSTPRRARGAALRVVRLFSSLPQAQQDQTQKSASDPRLVLGSNHASLTRVLRFSLHTLRLHQSPLIFALPYSTHVGDDTVYCDYSLATDSIVQAV